MQTDGSGSDSPSTASYAARPMTAMGYLGNLGLGLLLAAVCLGTTPSWAESGAGPHNGIAMHGSPKYGADFSNLDYVNPDAPKGGVLRMTVTGSFDTLNPYIIKGVSPPGRQYVFESLLKRTWDEPFSLYGLIAETIEVPDDRSWVAFTLRPEARFHDGTPITVDDVIFSLETLRDKGRPNHRLYYSRVALIERPGPRAVKFIFGPDADREMPLIMGLMPILSKAYYGKTDFTKTTLEPPLGSGPYRIAQVDPGRTIVYRRVDDYWGANLPINRGQNNFDEIRYDYYRNATVALEAFKAGESDIRRETDPKLWATAYDFPAVADGRIKLEVLPHGRPAGMRAMVFNTRRALFNDRRVRQALGYAFDFEWTNKAYFHGDYSRTESYFANSELASRGLPGPEELAILEPLRGQIPEEVFTTVYRPPATDGSGSIRANLQRARGLLAEAGWSVENTKLVHTATGRAMTFEILLLRPDNERIALAYARNLERLGITVRVRTVDSAQYQYRVQDYDFDMVFKTWYVTLSPGNEQRYYWGSEAAESSGSRNLAGIKDPAVDTLVDLIAAASDRGGLIARTRALDRVLLWGHYIVPLYHRGADRVVYWNKLNRPEVTPVYGYVIETWWSDSEKQ